MAFFNLSLRMLLLLASIFSFSAGNLLPSHLTSLANAALIKPQDGTATFQKFDKKEARSHLENPLAFRFLPSDENASKISHSTRSRLAGLETRAGDNLVQEYSADGKRTYEKIESVIEDVPDEDKDKINVQKNWEVEKTNAHPTDSTKAALKDIGIDASPGDFKDVNAILKTDADIHFRNLYGPKKGVLVAARNAAFRDNKRIAPDFWYDVVWSLWNGQCDTENVAPSDLRYVIQDTITNFVTDKILNESVREKGKDAKGDRIISRWTPKDDAFYAILQSPNGLGLAKILENYPKGIGYKRVKRISASYDADWETWTMWLELEENNGMPC